MTTTPLTNPTVLNAKPQLVDGVLKDKRYPDSGGLYLLATAKGGKLWRYNYSMNGKKYVYSLGKYPALSLKDARAIHGELKTLIAKGINPVEKKQNEKQEIKRSEKNSFKDVASDYLKMQDGKLAPSTLAKHKRALERDFYPLIGNMAIDKITRKDLIAVATAIQNRGAFETAHRLLNLSSQIWRYALQMDKVTHNVVADIDKKIALKGFQNSEYKTITEPKRIGELLRAIDTYKGSYTTKHLLRLLPFVFVRPSNIRQAEWSEFDLVNKVWIIPAEKIKTKQEHKLPLCDQAIKILEEVYLYTKDARYVFHSPLSRTRELSDVAVSGALKRLDFGDEIVPHGFRAMFSTLAYESGRFRGEVIEALLAHQDTNKVRSAYNRADYANEKRELVAWYGDYLEELKNGK